MPRGAWESNARSCSDAFAVMPVGMSVSESALVIHASAVAIAGRGLLILGASGAGKSGLALRLIALGADLVADDRVALSRQAGRLVARAPAALAGLVEARGIGILTAGSVPEAELALAVDLDRAAAARMPQRGAIADHGVSIELIFGRNVPNLDSALIILMQKRPGDPTGGSRVRGAQA
jgi:HPr kinase/phosphorylase